MNSTLFKANGQPYGSIWHYRNGTREGTIYDNTFAMGQSNGNYDAFFCFDEKFREKVGFSNDLSAISMTKAQLFLYPKIGTTFNVGQFAWSLAKWTDNLSLYYDSGNARMTVSNNTMVINASDGGSQYTDRDNGSNGLQNFLNHLKGYNAYGGNSTCIVRFYAAPNGSPYTEFYGVGNHPPLLVGFWNYANNQIVTNALSDIPLTTTPVNFTINDSTSDATYKIIATLEDHADASIEISNGTSPQFNFPPEWLQYIPYAQLVQVNFECKMTVNGVESSLEKFSIVFKVAVTNGTWKYDDSESAVSFIDYENKFGNYILSNKTNICLNPNAIVHRESADAAFITTIKNIYNNNTYILNNTTDKSAETGLWTIKKIPASVPASVNDNNEVTCEVTDSRLYTQILTPVEIDNVIAYTEPTITESITIFRAEEGDDGKQKSPAGTFIGINGEVRITTIGDNANSLQYKIEGGNFTPDSWNPISTVNGVLKLADNYTMFNNETVSASENREYWISFKDTVGSIVTQLLTVSGGKIVVHFPPEKSGIAFGGISTSDVNNPKAEFYYPIIANNGLNAIGATSYSTDETATGGTWIDGKKLYQKTIVCSVSDSTVEQSFAHTITNIDEIINIDGVYIPTNGVLRRCINWYYSNNIYTYTHWSINNNTVTFCFRAVLADDTPGKLYLTIIYTKTTDGD